jgi:ParB-like nuclease family protein
MADRKQEWPADKVERWPIDRLIPFARNARTHTPARITQIAASIREWGWTMPVLVGEDGGLIAGHGRVLAARQLGLAEIPVMVAQGWTEAQRRRAYRLADNQLALNAGWDPELLRLELGELKLEGFVLALTGFGDIELAGILADRTEGLTDPDDAPAVPEHPVSQPGDLWILGRHRLLCGDSTVATDVERVLGGIQPHLMVTDPPYGVDPATMAAARVAAGVTSLTCHKPTSASDRGTRPTNAIGACLERASQRFTTLNFSRQRYPPHYPSNGRVERGSIYLRRPMRV